MSAERLRQAADRIEQLAAEATPSPWKAVENYPYAWIVYGNQQRWPDDDRDWNDAYAVAYESNRGDIPPPDAKWIATLGPQIAGPLATWLRSEARYMDEERTDSSEPAIALARAILGEQP